MLGGVEDMVCPENAGALIFVLMWHGCRGLQMWAARDFKAVRTLAGHEGKIMGLDVAPGNASLYQYVCPILDHCRRTLSPCIHLFTSGPHVLVWPQIEHATPRCCASTFLLLLLLLLLLCTP